MKRRRKTFERQWKKWEKEKEGLTENGRDMERGVRLMEVTEDCETALNKV